MQCSKVEWSVPKCPVEAASQVTSRRRAVLSLVDSVAWFDSRCRLFNTNAPKDTGDLVFASSRSEFGFRGVCRIKGGKIGGRAVWRCRNCRSQSEGCGFTSGVVERPSARSSNPRRVLQMKGASVRCVACGWLHRLVVGPAGDSSTDSTLNQQSLIDNSSSSASQVGGKVGHLPHEQPRGLRVRCNLFVGKVREEATGDEAMAPTEAFSCSRYFFLKKNSSILP